MINKKKNIIIIVALCTIFATVGGCGGKDNSTPKKVNNTNASTSSTESAKKSNEPQIFNVGDKIQLKDFNVTINSIRTDYGNEYFKPKDGNEYFYVDCTVENISNETQTLSSMLMFDIRDSDGRRCNQAISVTANGQLDGTMSVGQKITGEYAVEIPSGKTGMQLMFNSSFLNSEQVVVQLN